MRLMGRHSPPVDGIPVANGHAPSLVPFTLPQLQVRQSGPMTPWPQPPKPSRWRHVTSAARTASAHRGWLAAVPVVLVNAVAFAGQLAFLRTHLPWTPAGQVLVAITLESVAVYLAWQAHLALAADDSALRLRLAAYGFAAVIGVMNYSHWMAPGWRPTFTAVTFGLMSVSSPWLWSVHSRRASRDALKAKGLIEPHAVRLGGTRWFWHLWPCIRVMSRATWIGENDPVKAIALLPAKAADGPADGPADAPAVPSPDVPPDPSPAEAGASQEAASEPPAPPSADARPKPRKRAAPPSARTRALAVLKADRDLSDAEVMKRAKVSESTAQRARKELAGAKS